MLDLILSTVGQGLQWSVLALGVFLTFRILDIADLSVEGSFPLGAYSYSFVDYERTQK